MDKRSLLYNWYHATKNHHVMVAAKLNFSPLPLDYKYKKRINFHRDYTLNLNTSRKGDLIKKKDDEQKKQPLN